MQISTWGFCRQKIKENKKNITDLPKNCYYSRLLEPRVGIELGYPSSSLPGS